jgi:hypothetical protein
MSFSPTRAIVSTEIRSPRRLWRSASLTAPTATWATWLRADDDDRLPKIGRAAGAWARRLAP